MASPLSGKKSILHFYSAAWWYETEYSSDSLINMLKTEPQCIELLGLGGGHKYHRNCSAVVAVRLCFQVKLLPYLDIFYSVTTLVFNTLLQSIARIQHWLSHKHAQNWATVHWASWVGRGHKYHRNCSAVVPVRLCFPVKLLPYLNLVFYTRMAPF